jgi:general secretion pathway protein D
LRRLATGSDTNARVYREAELPLKGGEETVPAAAPTNPPAAVSAPVGSELRFDPSMVTLKIGERATVLLRVSDIQDLFSIPLLLQYNPAVIQIEDVRDGGFLSRGSQEIAIVQRVDQQKGEAIISATRQPNIAGVNGGGTLFGIVIRAVAPGSSSIRILQVNARDSQQKQIALLSREAAIQVR